LTTAKSEKVITESTEIYPAGRGRVLVVSKKRILPKPKKHKPNPSFLHSIIKSNPECIKLKEYIGKDGIKRIVLFPEGRVLQHEERLDLACSLLITLPTIPDTLGVRNPSLFTKKVRKLCLAKMKRYRRWRNKNEKTLI